MSESENEAGFYYVFSLFQILFNKHIKLPLKRSHPPKPSLTSGNQSSSASAKHAGNQSTLRNTVVQSSIRGETEGENPLHFVFPRLLFSSGLYPFHQPPPSPQKSLGSE